MSHGPDDQDRVRRGVPSGGQFSGRERDESAVSLDMNGSFFYPPVFTDGRHLVEFWNRVEIPDEVLRRANAAYTKSYDAVAQEVPPMMRDMFRGMYAEQQPAPQDPAQLDEWTRAQNLYAAESVNAYREVLAARPRALHPSDVRQLVRAVAIEHYAETLTGDDAEYERYRARSSTMLLTSGTTTVSDINYRFALGSLREKFLFDRPDAPAAPAAPPASARPAPAPAAPASSGLTAEQVRQIVAEESTKSAYAMGNQQLGILEDRLIDLTKLVKDLK